MKSTLFGLLNIKNSNDLRRVSRQLEIKSSDLKNYSLNNIIPEDDDLNKILNYLRMSKEEYLLSLGLYNLHIQDLLRKNAKKISEIISEDSDYIDLPKFKASFKTPHGCLYNEDSLKLMKTLPSNSFDLIFADPPFNLGKKYESKIDDSLEKQKYLEWTERWIVDCIRLLKRGGSFFIWNLPKWNIYIANILDKYLNYRDWIAVDIKYGLPIKNRFYPSHYSLLYYVKGTKPNTFNNERIPLDVCNYCGHELKDYGGYKKKMNPSGVNLSDVWKDIYPVRHKKFKNRRSNELPLKLLDRIISISTNPGDTVFDPFGGSGTTYIAAEILHRKWIGSEIGPIDPIVKRFEKLKFEAAQIDQLHSKKNLLFLPKIKELRKKNNFWLPEDFDLDN